MISRDSLVWGAAIGVSLLLHLTLLLDSGSHAGAERPRVEKSTRVSFRSVSAPLTSPRDLPQQEERKKVEAEVVEAPEPPPEPVKKREEKHAERVRQPQPPKPQPQSEPESPSPPTTEVAEKPSTVQQATAGTIADPGVIEQEKHEYLRRLMAHIEAHKHYPRVARRRGIEGTVAVSFTLHAGGTLADVAVTEGHPSLRQAVEEALVSAQPLPPPPPGLALPMSISFTVRFALYNG